MADTIIKVKNLGKKYIIHHQTKERYTALRDVIVRNAISMVQSIVKPLNNYGLNPSREEIWALRNINLDVEEGEVIGIIGRNGAGKSTLLKVLSRITEPTTGHICIKGRVASLLEVGTGFHPELTGRENIYLNGAILGMHKAEIKRKFDEIVAFAETEKFLDTPVKRYSSGMRVRLAFSVAAHLEPEILVVDEVLAVGDSQFQKKCLGKMEEVSTGMGRTVLFVSHNMRAITDLCPHSIWLENGSIHRQGTSESVVSEYLSFGSSTTGQWQRPKTIPSANELELIEAKIDQSEPENNGIVLIDKPFKIEVKYEVKSFLKGSAIVLQLRNSSGIVVFTSWDTDSNTELINEREPHRYRSICKVPGYLLKPGNYSVTIAAHIYRNRVLDIQRNIFSFIVSDIGYKFNKEREGIVSPVLDWLVEII